MIDLDALVQRLIDEAPVFQRAVVQVIAGTTPPGYPQAHVILVAESADPNVDVPGVQQRVVARVGIEYRVKAAGRGGAAGVDSLAVVRAETRAALLGWSPAEGIKPFEFDRGGLVDYEPGRIHWRDLFLTEYYEVSR